MSLVYGWKYSKTKMEFIFVSIEKNLIKFIQEFANCQNKPTLVAVVKTFMFVTDLNLAIYALYWQWKKQNIMENLFKNKWIWIWIKTYNLKI